MNYIITLKAFDDIETILIPDTDNNKKPNYVFPSDKNDTHSEIKNNSHPLFKLFNQNVKPFMPNTNKHLGWPAVNYLILILINIGIGALMATIFKPVADYMGEFTGDKELYKNFKLVM